MFGHFVFQTRCSAVLPLSKATQHMHTFTHVPADTMHDRAPELHPVLAPPGCHVSDLGGESPSGSKIFWTKTSAEESSTAIDAGESEGTASSS